MTPETLHCHKLFEDIMGYLSEDTSRRYHLSEVKERKELGKELRGERHINEDVFEFPEKTHKTSPNVLLCYDFPSLMFIKQLSDV
jgi:hypothetical protein